MLIILQTLALLIVQQGHMLQILLGNVYQNVKALNIIGGIVQHGNVFQYAQLFRHSMLTKH